MKSLKLFLKKTMLLTLSVSLFFSTSFANWGHGSGGSDGGGGFDLNGFGQSPGGGSFGSHDSLSIGSSGHLGSGSGSSDSNFGFDPNAFTNLMNTLNSSSSSSETSDYSTGRRYGNDNYVRPSAWDESPLNPIVNPVAGILMGRRASDLNREPTQSFGALIFSQSPLALFLDLNGDGVRGDMIDGMLFNLYFESSLRSDSYVMASGRANRRAVVGEAGQNPRMASLIKEGLQTTRIVLMRQLKDGRKSASLKDLYEIIRMKNALGYAYADLDRETALASILMLTVLNPGVASSDGPVVTTADANIGASIKKVHQDLEDILPSDLQFDRGGTALALKVSLARLATVMGLAEAGMNLGVDLGSDSIEALRGALYFTAFEFKRLAISNEKREALLQKSIEVLVKRTPNVLKLAATKAVGADALARLEKSVVSLAPVVNRDDGLSPKGRMTVAAVAAGTALAIWMIGGDWAVSHLTSDIALQLFAKTSGFGLLPLLSGKVAHGSVGNNHSLPTTSVEAVEAHKNLCELALKALKK